ncbi:MAG: HD domain-containing protein [Acholeplasmatales bacterium]|nr:HD domain-containing protein [Acholeplasmatales bacterium]
MFTKLPRTKVFRDPLYGYITVDYKIISDLIDTKEIQRLRRIRQLAGVGMVFQTAEHSRFTHSLGAYHMANLVIKNVDGMNEIPEYEKVLFLCAALLHDVGHGPFSHAFENVISISHEEYTTKIIKTNGTEINKVLSIQEGLADDIASVIEHDGKYPLIESLVSSQLDVDRMDYLSRDAYMTGAAYGNIDYFRIMRSMRVLDNKIICKASGVHSIESYLMSRYHMYFQVYYHPTARSFEVVLEAIYQRILDLHKEGYRFEAKIGTFIKVLNDSNNLEAYNELDDYYVTGFIKQLAHSKDKVLAKLCKAFLNRNLFKVVDLADDPDPAFIEELNNKYGNDPYFYKRVSAKGQAYMHSKKSDINDIKVLLPNGSIKSLDQYSPIIKSLVSSSYTEINRIYYFED